MKALGKALLCASVCVFTSLVAGVDSACIDGAHSVTGLVKRLPSGRTLLATRHALCEQDLTVDERRYLQLITNEGDSPRFPTELRAALASSDTSEAVLIWTNRSYLTRATSHYPFLSFHCAYDALEWNRDVWLCYNCAGVLFLEKMPVLRVVGPRERLLLAGGGSEIEPVDAWTNAVFSISSNGIPQLTGYGDLGSVVIWRWDDGDWVIDPRASHPESAYNRARRLWRWEHQETPGRWSVVRTNPGPKQQLKP